jgi:hypothetical protein
MKLEAINCISKTLLTTPLPLIWGDFFTDQLKLNGKVGVGLYAAGFPSTVGSANVSNYNLFVKGGILTDEVRVRTTWADYVFSDMHELKPLSELEAYIKENTSPKCTFGKRSGK